MNIYSYTKNKILQSYSKKFLCTAQEYQKSVQVSVVGAHTQLGRLTSLLLKQNPLVQVLRLHVEYNAKSLEQDLSHIDTKCKVQGFEGSDNISKSIRGSDIILILGVQNFKEDVSLADRLMKEGKRVYDIAKECTNYSPRSIIVVAVPPVSATTVLVEGVFKQTHWYHPSRIVGSAAIAQTKANTLMGRFQNLDPHICNVPIIGGPDQDIAVPLFSKAAPVEVHDSAAKQMILKYRGIRDHEFPKIVGRPNSIESCPSSEAFALSNMISNIALGLCGDKMAFCNAYVRSNIINTCKHLVTTVQFSRGGFVHNCGIPWLTKLELQLLERAALHIKEREQMAKEFLEHIECGKQEMPPFKQKEIEVKKLLQQTVVRG